MKTARGINVNRVKEKRTSRRRFNPRINNEAKSALDIAKSGAGASLIERLEANNAELDKLNDMI
ncbi:hypothetical protein HPB50_025915 [Hyalomma asiaticum]|uniref:Uncharacterized protein n=1 Tax=Hyalomma asiaticum TaxID=266040 RepID=A0ACB7RR87_HYAAI|nr:hypothetical protein HPB50_025915 [Hyalomma asiaticum]